MYFKFSGLPNNLNFILKMKRQVFKCIMCNKMCNNESIRKGDTQNANSYL